LVELTPKKRAATQAEKQLFYSMALHMAKSRGYSDGWAGHKYRDRFGVWPRGLSRISTPPDQAFLNWEKSRRIAWAKRKAKEAGQ